MFPPSSYAPLLSSGQRNNSTSRQPNCNEKLKPILSAQMVPPIPDPNSSIKTNIPNTKQSTPALNPDSRNLNNDVFESTVSNPDHIMITGGPQNDDIIETRNRALSTSSANRPDTEKPFLSTDLQSQARIQKLNTFGDEISLGKDQRRRKPMRRRASTTVYADIPEQLLSIGSIRDSISQSGALPYSHSSCKELSFNAAQRQHQQEKTFTFPYSPSSSSTLSPTTSANQNKKSLVNKKKHVGLQPSLSPTNITESQTDLSGFSEERSKVIKEYCLYCTSYGPIPGIVSLCSYAITFEPDVRCQEVKEFGIGQFQVYIDLNDITACAAVMLPGGPFLTRYLGFPHDKITSNGLFSPTAEEPCPGFFQILLKQDDQPLPPFGPTKSNNDPEIMNTPVGNDERSKTHTSSSRRGLKKLLKSIGHSSLIAGSTGGRASSLHHHRHRHMTTPNLKRTDEDDLDNIAFSNRYSPNTPIDSTLKEKNQTDSSIDDSAIDAADTFRSVVSKTPFFNIDKDKIRKNSSEFDDNSEGTSDNDIDSFSFERGRITRFASDLGVVPLHSFEEKRLLGENDEEEQRQHKVPDKEFLNASFDNITTSQTPGSAVSLPQVSCPSVKTLSQQTLPATETLSHTSLKQRSQHSLPELPQQPSSLPPLKTTPETAVLNALPQQPSSQISFSQPPVPNQSQGLFKAQAQSTLESVSQHPLMATTTSAATQQSSMVQQSKHKGPNKNANVDSFTPSDSNEKMSTVKSYITKKVVTKSPPPPPPPSSPQRDLGTLLLFWMADHRIVKTLTRYAIDLLDSQESAPPVSHSTKAIEGEHKEKKASFSEALEQHTKNKNSYESNDQGEPQDTTTTCPQHQKTSSSYRHHTLSSLTTVPFNSSPVFEMLLLSPRAQADIINAATKQLECHGLSVDDIPTFFRTVLQYACNFSRQGYHGDSFLESFVHERSSSRSSMEDNILRTVIYTPTVQQPEGNIALLLTSHVALQLCNYIPPSLGVRYWKLRFCTQTDGISYQTFYRKLEDEGPALFLISDMEGSLFGAFCPTSVRESSRYYGTGECFVFTFNESARSYIPPGQRRRTNTNFTKSSEPIKDVDALNPWQHINVFNWSSKNSMFVFTDSKSIVFGGGGTYAITIDSNFLRGTSEPCDTFLSPCLASSPDFIIHHFQVWCFTDP